MILWPATLLLSSLSCNRRDGSLEEMKTALADIARAEDVYYATNFRYSASESFISSLTLPRGIQVTIEGADEHGWRATAFYFSGGRSCRQSGRNDGDATFAVLAAPDCTGTAPVLDVGRVVNRKPPATPSLVRSVSATAVAESPAAITPSARSSDTRPELLPASAEEDNFGYPSQTVDRLAVRGLLWVKAYDELDALLSAYADSAQRDYRLEYRLFDAYDAFRVAVPAMEPLLSEWVKLRPQSPEALLARATFFRASGWHARGTRSSGRTSAQQFTRMTSFFKLAVADLDAALRLSPNSIVAYRQIMNIALSTSDRATSRRILDQGLKIQPNSFLLRAAHMEILLPRWGGSYEAMSRFADESAPYAAQNPRIRSLRGFVDWDRGRVFAKEGKIGDAAEAYQRAIDHGDFWQFREARGEYYAQSDQNEEALDDLNRALAQNPQNAEVLSARAGVAYELGRLASDEVRAARFSQAFRDIKMAVALNPVDDGYQEQLAFLQKAIPQFAPPNDS